jgi:hypothetical protein
MVRERDWMARAQEKGEIGRGNLEFERANFATQ